MPTPIAPRFLVILLAILLAAPGTAPAEPAAERPLDLPRLIAIERGVVIAHGNELAPPFTLAIESDTLCIYDTAGRRFTSTAAPRRGEPSLPVPRLLTPAAAPAAPALELQMAQIAHLLAAGGALAFGRSYLIVFPPASAATVLPDLRWAAAHAPVLSDRIPQASAFLRDLLWPLRLVPASVEEGPAEEPASSEILVVPGRRSG